MATARRGGDRWLTEVVVDLPNHWAESRFERLWARQVGDDLFELHGMPFFAYDLNYLDVVRATPRDGDGLRVVRGVTRRSGHTTVRVVFRPASGPRERRVALLSELRNLDVSYEAYDESYFALDIAPRANVTAILDRLESFEKKDLLGFETCEARVPGSFDADE